MTINKKIEEQIEEIARRLSLLGFEPTDETQQAEYYRLLNESLQTIAKQSAEEERGRIKAIIVDEFEELMLSFHPDNQGEKIIQSWNHIIARIESVSKKSNH